ncbi:MAG TPA: peptide-methionine (R)-S-oxide reductase MsrB [Chlamydiales bacterium]|nr:peptide-methionine (R)-S-oxide reductase MsrB [Chlamydiales bacterium]
MHFVKIFALIMLLAIWNGEKLSRSEAEWQEMMEEEQFRVMRRQGTERAFSGKYLFMNREGTYHCSGCDLPLWRAADKYQSGSGWPSFRKPIAPKNVYYLPDSTPYVQRYEVLCSRCDSHLGHVFHDGPPPKELRYCINSIAINLRANIKYTE